MRQSRWSLNASSNSHIIGHILEVFIPLSGEQNPYFRNWWQPVNEPSRIIDRLAKLTYSMESLNLTAGKSDGEM